LLRRPATTLRRGEPEAAGMSRRQIEAVATRAREWVESRLVQAVVVLAARHGIVVLHEAIGRLTPDEDSPSVAADSIFPIASISKVFTATALMQLVEDGRVGLNRRVREYIPEFAGEGKDAVLVRHLLTHTSGIKEEQLEAYAKEQQGMPLAPAEPTLHPLMNEYLARRFHCPLWKPPSVEMSYADFNFDLLGEIVRRMSGTSLAQYFGSHIVGPLRLSDTTLTLPVSVRHRAVRHPTGAWNGDTADTPEAQQRPLASGAVWSTAWDLAVFGQMFLNRGGYGSARVLGPASVGAMTRNQIPGVGATLFSQEVFAEASWGFGWSVHGRKTGECGTLYSADAVEHWGTGRSYVWVDLALDIVGVYLSVLPINREHPDFARHNRHDLFTDAVTAAVVET
jgi:CubicO group peptidase (beta-lactamase class C family)